MEQWWSSQGQPAEQTFEADLSSIAQHISANDEPGTELACDQLLSDYQSYIGNPSTLDVPILPLDHVWHTILNNLHVGAMTCSTVPDPNLEYGDQDLSDAQAEFASFNNTMEQY